METNNHENIKYLAAKKRVKKIKGFYIHALVYVLVNIFIISNNVYDGQSLADMDNYWTAIFWGLGLLVHAMSVFISDFMFGSNWEERKIKEYMDQNR